MNLARTLDDAARPHPRPPGRPARRPRCSPTPSSTTSPPAPPTGCASAGVEPGRPGRASCCPTSPQFPVALLRGAARGRHGRPDEPAAQGARGRALPRRLRRQAGVRPDEPRGRGAAPRAVGRARPSRSTPTPSPRSPRGPPSPEIAARADDDTAVILYTSGTTGTPEGRRADPRQPAPQRRRDRDRRCSTSAPTTWSWAACRCSTPSARPAGSTPRSPPAACLTLIPRFDPAAALKVIERDRVTRLRGRADDVRRACSPTGAGVADTSTLRLCISGGAALPVEVLRGFEQAFGTRRSWRATGCPRPRRWPRSTAPTAAQAGLDRRCRSRASS